MPRFTDILLYGLIAGVALLICLSIAIPSLMILTDVPSPFAEGPATTDAADLELTYSSGTNSWDGDTRTTHSHEVVLDRTTATVTTQVALEQAGGGEGTKWRTGYELPHGASVENVRVVGAQNNDAVNTNYRGNTLELSYETDKAHPVTVAEFTYTVSKLHSETYTRDNHISHRLDLHGVDGYQTSIKVTTADETHFLSGANYDDFTSSYTDANDPDDNAATFTGSGQFTGVFHTESCPCDATRTNHYRIFGEQPTEAEQAAYDEAYTMALRTSGYDPEIPEVPVVILDEDNWSKPDIIGYYNGGVIYIRESYSDPNNGILAHETAHVINGQLQPDTATWFNEGSADLTAAAYLHSRGQTVEAFGENSIKQMGPGLLHDYNQNGLQQPSGVLAYEYGHLYVRNYIAQNGVDGYHDALEDIRQADTDDQTPALNAFDTTSPTVCDRETVEETRDCVDSINAQTEDLHTMFPEETTSLDSGEEFTTAAEHRYE